MSTTRKTKQEQTVEGQLVAAADKVKSSVDVSLSKSEVIEMVLEETVEELEKQKLRLEEERKRLYEVKPTDLEGLLLDSPAKCGEFCSLVRRRTGIGLREALELHRRLRARLGVT